MQSLWFQRLASFANSISANATSIRAVEVERAARDAADASLSEIALRTNSAMARMGVSESRGYLNARARRPVARQVAAMFRNDQRYDSATQQQIVNKAIAHAVRILGKHRVPQAAPTMREAA